MRRGTSTDRVDLLEETTQDAVPAKYGTHEPEGAAVHKTDLISASCCRRCSIRSEPIMRHVRSWWKSAVVILTPVLLLPILLLWKDQVPPSSFSKYNPPPPPPPPIQVTVTIRLTQDPTWSTPSSFDPLHTATRWSQLWGTGQEVGVAPEALQCTAPMHP